MILPHIVDENIFLMEMTNLNNITSEVGKYIISECATFHITYTTVRM